MDDQQQITVAAAARELGVAPEEVEAIHAEARPRLQEYRDFQKPPLKPVVWYPSGLEVLKAVISKDYPLSAVALAQKLGVSADWVSTRLPVAESYGYQELHQLTLLLCQQEFKHVQWSHPYFFWIGALSGFEKFELSLHRIGAEWIVSLTREDEDDRSYEHNFFEEIHDTPYAALRLLRIKLACFSSILLNDAVFSIEGGNHEA